MVGTMKASHAIKTSRMQFENRETRPCCEAGNSESTAKKVTPLTTKKYMALTALCIVALTEALDATSIAVVLPVIAESLSSSTTVTFSLAASFLLASTVFQPVFVSLSCVLGRNITLLLALVLFLIGAIIAGSTKDVFVLLGGRIVQGIGAAGSISLSVVILTDIVSLRRRALWLGAINAMWAIGSVSGPVIGGAFVHTNWRWVFWINIPLIVISCTSLAIFLRLEFPKEPVRSRLLKVDYMGITLFLVSASAFLVPLSLAGTILPWSSWRLLLPLILGFIGLVAFFCHQKWIARHPVVPLSVFGNRTAILGHAGGFANGMLICLLLYYIPLYYEGILGYSPLITGVAVFPETFTIAPANIVTAIIISKTGKFRLALVVGWMLTTIGMGLLCLLKESTPAVVWIFINIVPGIGLGMMMPATAIAIQASTKESDVAPATSTYYLLRTCGQTVGVAIGQTIFRAQLKSVLQVGDISPESTVEGLLKILRGLRENGVENGALIKDIVRALKAVWGCGCAIAGIMGIASLFMESYSLDQDVEVVEAAGEKAA